MCYTQNVPFYCASDVCTNRPALCGLPGSICGNANWLTKSVLKIYQMSILTTHMPKQCDHAKFPKPVSTVITKSTTKSISSLPSTALAQTWTLVYVTTPAWRFKPLIYIANANIVTFDDFIRNFAIFQIENTSQNMFLPTFFSPCAWLSPKNTSAIPCDVAVKSQSLQHVTLRCRTDLTHCDIQHGCQMCGFLLNPNSRMFSLPSIVYAVARSLCYDRKLPVKLMLYFRLLGVRRRPSVWIFY